MVGANGGILLHQDATPLRENGLDLADVRRMSARCALVAGDSRRSDRLFRCGLDTAIARNRCEERLPIALVGREFHGIQPT
jgi:hypothetical protein